uniref:ATP synthase complex subunit 8 n=1 Tax=Pseudoxiphophorus bimaculatus TaxID=119480 RepID=K9MSG9_9TELE|nr:ATP synthase F0 subunit 8 [Pseudoxiphophorus bimaculatus]AFX69433.1 ATP synthase F0 subunit 8 [Pseudoxiphophorus bimaculatus]
MPQLIPAPWFAYLLCSWWVYLMVVLPKVSAYLFPKDPASKDEQKPQALSWHWPWY